MSPISIGVVALSLSVDAFIAALGRGSRQSRGLSRALTTGAIFGAVAALAPLLGWAFGMAASRHVQAVDHWIAFALLGGVGLHMLVQALAPAEGDRPADTHWTTLATAVGTSIDALAVGVSLAFLDADIMVIALAIGLTTMAMSATGLLAGGLLGLRFGRIAEVCGGVALIGLGASILIGHLTA